MSLDKIESDDNTGNWKVVIGLVVVIVIVLTLLLVPVLVMGFKNEPFENTYYGTFKNLEGFNKLQVPPNLKFTSREMNAIFPDIQFDKTRNNLSDLENNGLHVNLPSDVKNKLGFSNMRWSTVADIKSDENNLDTSNMENTLDNDVISNINKGDVTIPTELIVPLRESDKNKSADYLSASLMQFKNVDYKPEYSQSSNLSSVTI